MGLSNNAWRAKILYRATMEENTRDDFHRKCDNKGNTIAIIESTKRTKIREYSSLSLDSIIGRKMIKKHFYQV